MVTSRRTFQEHWERLLFRDYLIAHPQAARAYERLNSADYSPSKDGPMKSPNRLAGMIAFPAPRYLTSAVHTRRFMLSAGSTC
jgi:hypothetical protein